MPGRYNGGDFSLGKDASLGEIFAIQERQNEQAARNIAAALGVTHGDLVAATGSGPSSGSGPGNAAVRVGGPANTGGPAAGVVGSARTGGPGNLGVFTGASVSGRVVFRGPLQMANDTKVTRIRMGGYDLVQDRGFVDAGAVEQRYGDTDFLTPAWFYNWVVTGADGWATLQSVAPISNVDPRNVDWPKVGAGAGQVVNGALTAAQKAAMGLINGPLPSNVVGFDPMRQGAH